MIPPSPFLPLSPAVTTYLELRQEHVRMYREWGKLRLGFSALCNAVGEGHQRDVARQWFIDLLRLRSTGVPLVRAAASPAPWSPFSVSWPSNVPLPRTFL